VTEDSRQQVDAEVSLKNIDDRNQGNAKQKYAKREFYNLENNMHHDHHDHEHAGSD